MEIQPKGHREGFVVPDLHTGVLSARIMSVLTQSGLHYREEIKKIDIK